MRSILLLVLIVTMLGACSEAPGESPAFMVRDSAGIRIVSSLRPRYADTIQIDEAPVVVIPSDFGAPDHFLDDVDYVVGRSGRGLVVGNGGTRELFVFDGHGEFERAVGGAGNGPGELENLYGLVPCGLGRVIVTEVRRLSVFGDDGTFETTVPIVGHLAEFRGSAVAGRPDCSGVLMFTGSTRVPVPGDYVVDLVGHLYWADFANGARDTVATFTMGQAQAWNFRGNLGWARFPFSRRAVWATDGERVVIGRGNSAELDVHGGDGVVSHIRWAAPMRALMDSDWNLFEQRYAQFFEENPEEEAFLPNVEFYHRPKGHPPYSALKLGPEGRFWLQRYEAYGPFRVVPSVHWTVLNYDGEWLAEVRLPADFELLAVGASHIVGSVRDALDVQELRAYALPTQLTSP